MEETAGQREGQRVEQLGQVVPQNRLGGRDVGLGPGLPVLHRLQEVRDGGGEEGLEDPDQGGQPDWPPGVPEVLSLETLPGGGAEPGEEGGEHPGEGGGGGEVGEGWEEAAQHHQHWPAGVSRTQAGPHTAGLTITTTRSVRAGAGGQEKMKYFRNINVLNNISEPGHESSHLSSEKAREF